MINNTDFEAEAVKLRESGLEYLNGINPDYAKAVECFEQAIKLGDLRAQAALGRMYFDGKGVEQDKERAYFLWCAGAERGDAGMQASVGCCLWEGDGVTADIDKALEWFNKAADQDNADAHNMLGNYYCDDNEEYADYPRAMDHYLAAVENGCIHAYANVGYMYYNGMGFEVDKNAAFDWYTKGAAAGSAIAQSTLGNFYRDGEIVDQDKKQAMHWYELAAAQGDVRAQASLAYFYRVDEDFERANHYYRMAAERGHSQSQLWLGYHYENGRGVPRDYLLAYEWYCKASERGNANAMGNIADLFNEGRIKIGDSAVERGKEPDFEQARFWYEKAAEHGYVWAMRDLGSMYFDGNGVDIDYVKAAEHYQQAAEHGNEAAQFEFARCLVRGHGVEIDIKQAEQWLIHAAEKGNANAQCMLAQLYFYGRGVEQDYERAVIWLHQAAKSHNRARFLLGFCYEHGLGVEKDLGAARELYVKAAAKQNSGAQFRLGLLSIKSDAAQRYGGRFAYERPNYPELNDEQRRLLTFGAILSAQNLEGCDTLELTQFADVCVPDILYNSWDIYHRDRALYVVDYLVKGDGHAEFSDEIFNNIIKNGVEVVDAEQLAMDYSGLEKTFATTATTVAELLTEDEVTTEGQRLEKFARTAGYYWHVLGRVTRRVNEAIGVFAKVKKVLNNIGYTNDEIMAVRSTAAWDYGRGVTIARYCCEAGFISVDELFEFCQIAADNAVKMYDDWRQFVAGYALGRAVGFGNDCEGIEKTLKYLLSSNGAFAKVPFKK